MNLITRTLHLALLATWIAFSAGCVAAQKQKAVEANHVEFAAPSQAGSTETVQLTGVLSLPAGKGPFAAVVLMHGCSGMGKNMSVWREFWNAHGVAALSVDSFTGRGVKEVCTGQSRVTPLTRAGDAYAALEYLAGLPDIDTSKVMLVGYSHGGGVALAAASASVISSRSPGGPRFKAATAFYPGCGGNASMQAAYQIPVLILSGEADDWTPAQDCRRLVETHNGQNMSITTYPGALHGFDAARQPRTYRPDVLNKNSPTGKGATVGGDPAALEAARRDVLEFFRSKVSP